MPHAMPRVKMRVITEQTYVCQSKQIWQNVQQTPQQQKKQKFIFVSAQICDSCVVSYLRTL